MREHATHLTLCGIPRSGFWMYEDNVTDLDLLMPPSELWADRAQNPEFNYSETEGWPLTGFAADLVVSAMAFVGGDVSFSARMYPSYTQALFATSKAGECDVAFSPFTVTQNRTYCGNVSLASGVRACTDPVNSTAEPSTSDACCADYSFQMLSSTVGVLIRTGDPISYLSIVDVNIVNIVLMTVFMLLLLAHMVWFVEICSLKSRQFSRNYSVGIWDSIYWATCTVTSVGYGDFAPATCLGKFFTIIGMFLGLIFTAVLTASISSKLTADELNFFFEISDVNQLPSGMKLCTASRMYANLGTFAHTDIVAVSSLAECYDGLLAHSYDGVVNDEPVLRNYLNTMTSKAADANSDGILDFHVLTGNDDIYLAPIVSPALPTELRSIFEQGYVQAIHDESSYEALLRKYFGAVVNSADVQDTELLGVDDFEYDELEWWLLGVVGTYAVALAVVKFVSAVQDRVFCRVWQGIQKVYAKEQRRLRLDRVVSRSSMRMLDGKATSPTSANSHARKLSGGRLQREARAKRAHAMEMTWLGRQLSPRSSLGSGSDSPFEEEDMTAPAMVFRKIDMDAKGFLVEEDIEMLVQLVESSEALLARSTPATLAQVDKFLRGLIEHDEDEDAIYEAEFEANYRTSLKMRSAQKLLANIVHEQYDSAEKSVSAESMHTSNPAMALAEMRRMATAAAATGVAVGLLDTIVVGGRKTARVAPDPEHCASVTEGARALTTPATVNVQSDDSLRLADVSALSRQIADVQAALTVLLQREQGAVPMSDAHMHSRPSASVRRPLSSPQKTTSPTRGAQDQRIHEPLSSGVQESKLGGADS